DRASAITWVRRPCRPPASFRILRRRTSPRIGRNRTPVRQGKAAATERTPITTSSDAISYKRKDTLMSDASKQDWSKPAAMAIPKGGLFEDNVQQGRYGPIYPKTPACYGFSVLAKIIPGREEVIREYGRTLAKGVAETPDLLEVLKLHYLRWL